jgi:hypothetical protein
MSPRGKPQKPSLHRVSDFQRISPDDVKFKMLERDRLAAMDDRDDAARWLGDQPKHRSALAMKQSQDAVRNPYARLRPDRAQTYGTVVNKVSNTK